jgi:RNA polymerase sigma-70 factor (ECF subfamily)
MFAQTMWTQIRQAKAQDPKALEAIILRYRPAIEMYVRRSGFQDADAQDLVQEILLRIVEDDLLLKAEEGRGKFRSLVLGISKNVIGDWLRAKGRLKRGGGASVASLDRTGWADLISSEVRDEEFDRGWAANLVRMALDRLREECERTGSPHFAALFAHMNEDLTYAQLADRLGVKESDVRNYLHHGKSKLRGHLEEVIRGCASSGEEFDLERAYLLGFL